MTQKELSYIEDAVGHEVNIISIIEETLKNLEDENLVTFFEQELNVHTTIKDNLLEKLEEKVNE